VRWASHSADVIPCLSAIYSLKMVSTSSSPACFVNYGWEGINMMEVELKYIFYIKINSKYAKNFCSLLLKSWTKILLILIERRYFEFLSEKNRELKRAFRAHESCHFCMFSFAFERVSRSWMLNFSSLCASEKEKIAHFVLFETEGKTIMNSMRCLISLKHAIRFSLIIILFHKVFVYFCILFI
jgi:hypothetical protein